MDCIYMVSIATIHQAQVTQDREIREAMNKQLWQKLQDHQTHTSLTQRSVRTIASLHHSTIGQPPLECIITGSRQQLLNSHAAATAAATQSVVT